MTSLAPSLQRPSLLPSLHLKAFPTFRFSPSYGQWRDVSTTAPTNASVARLAVVTYNVLFNHFEADKIHTSDRNARLIEILECCDADVIGLCEAKSKHKWLNGVEEGITVRPYGQLILAKFPFRLLSHSFSPHKRAIFGVFSINSRTTIVSAVHLTSDHAKNPGERSASVKRVEQLAYVYNAVNAIAGENGDKDSVESLIIGDFNTSDGEAGEDLLFHGDYEDAWTVLRPDEKGYTFDPEVNPLAQLMTLTGIRRRLDRMFLRTATGHWKPQEIAIIGNEPFTLELPSQSPVTLFPSDHFGVIATFQYEANPKPRAPSSPPVINRFTLTPVLSKYLSEIDLISMLKGMHVYETVKGNMQRQQAVELLEKTLSVVFKGAPCRLLTCGSYALGLHSPSSDIDCVAVGPFKLDDFLKRGAKVFATTPGMRLIKIVRDAIVPIVQLSVFGVPVDVQYVHYTSSLKNGIDFARIAPNELRRVDVKSAIALSAYVDTLILRDEMAAAKGSGKFVTLCCAVRTWAKRNSVYSNKHGFLGGYGWMILVARIVQLFPDCSVVELLFHFFLIYSNWSWRNTPVGLAVLGKVPSYRMQPREKLCVLTIDGTKNSSRNVTRSTCAILERAFASALDNINKHNISTLFEEKDFFADCTSFLQIAVEAVSAPEFDVLTSWIVDLLVRIEALSDKVSLHPSVHRYRLLGSGYPYSCAIYIGLAINLDAGNRLSLSPAIDGFTEVITAWYKYSGNMRMVIHHVKRDNIASVDRLEEFFEGVEEEPDSTDEEKESEEKSPKNDNGAKESKTSKVEKTSSSSPQGIGTSEKFYNRIKWDPELRREDFFIGYEDRFLGMKEVAFDDFRKVDFVPWHRVWYFKKGNDVVWDRKARTCTM